MKNRFLAGIESINEDLLQLILTFAEPKSKLICKRINKFWLATILRFGCLDCCINLTDVPYPWHNGIIKQTFFDNLKDIIYHNTKNKVIREIVLTEYHLDTIDYAHNVFVKKI